MSERTASVARACSADAGIRALDQVVTALCVAAGACDGPACSACTWEHVVKPLARPLIGWERGYPPMAAKDPREPGAPLYAVDLGELMSRMDERKAHRTPETSDTERWLRSQEAWDAVTRSWIARLYEADPGAGHGIAYLSAVTS